MIKLKNFDWAAFLLSVKNSPIKQIALAFALTIPFWLLSLLQYFSKISNE